jgi:transposase
MPEVYFTTNPDGEDSVGQASPLPISITYGYSRAHKPDLKQFMLDITCSGDGDVPLFLRAADGNSADSSVFAQILCEFKKQLEVEGLMVADSALYRDNNLKLLGNLKWLSRTPLTIKQAKQLISQLMESDFRESQIPGYRWSEHPSNYGGIEERWLVVESEIRRQSERRQLEKKVEKAEQEGQKKLRELSAQKFACGPDALVAAQTLSKQLNYHDLTDIKREHNSEKTRKTSPKKPKNFIQFKPH